MGEQRREYNFRDKETRQETTAGMLRRVAGA